MEDTSACGTFTKTDCRLDHKTSLNKSQRSESIQICYLNTVKLNSKPVTERYLENPQIHFDQDVKLGGERSTS